MASTSRAAQFQAYKHPTGSPATSQAKRRQDALNRQREDRQKSFSLARDGLDALTDALDLSSDEEEDPLQDNSGELPTPNDAALAEKSQDVESSSGASEDAMQVESRANHKKSSIPKAIKRKWKVYADRLMLGESLDYNEGLPPDLCEEWLAVGPIPPGKRCMAVTFNSVRTSQKGRITNTLLLARSSGRPLSRHLIPALPPNCVLDCIYSEEKAILFVIDILQWKRQSMTESEAEFRMFWRDSKLAELGPQPLPSTVPTAPASAPIATAKYPRRSKPPQLVVIPIPSFSAPLQPQDLLSGLIEPALRGETVNLSYQALVTSSSSEGSGIPNIHTVPVSYEVDGLMLLVKSACYESGLTPLALWIAKDELQHFRQLLMSGPQIM